MNSVELSVKGVVWDLDGTLLDSFGLFESTLTEVLSRRGLDVPSHDVLLDNYHGRLRDAIRSTCGLGEALLDTVCVDFMQTEEEHYQQPEGLYFPDAIDLLQRNRAAGLRQIVVSNRSHGSEDRLGSPRNLAKRKPLAGLIDLVVCGDDNDFCKPDARMLNEAECTLKLEGSTLVVVGDQFVDAQLAYNLGCPAVLVSRSGEPVPHLDKLHDGWRSDVSIVKTLLAVSLTPTD
jgi:phosphoglycolate phosphatase-like HAD superfamily hydrolase